MNTATPEQIDRINTLKGDRDLTVDDGRGYRLLRMARVVWGQERFTQAVAGILIDQLTDLPKKGDLAPEGMHRVGNRIYKVQRAVHGSGNLYAKQLVPYDNGDWKFEYAAGMVRKLSSSTLLTLQDAKRWGALYGTCALCGRTLTDENSIRAGIGPVCAGKL